MLVFEWILILAVGAVVLTAIARRTGIPYPALLAVAGAALAAQPYAPHIEIAPDLALAIFVAPVLVDAAFDTSPRDLWGNLVPVTSLVVVAVAVTTAAVAYVGMVCGHLPFWAAVALGAIVAPPDAAAAAAVLPQLHPPRRILAILEGEALLNDAVALLIFRLAVVEAVGATRFSHAAPQIALAAALSPVAGYVAAIVYKYALRELDDAPSNTLMQFACTFGVWILADRLGLSPVITMVVYAMTLAHTASGRSNPRNRISSYAVWETAVFALNVLAFVLMGLQMRPILDRLSQGDRLQALDVGLAVLATVIVTRFVYVMSYNTAVRLKNRLFGARLSVTTPPTARGGLVVAWCGMRGLVTLAAAFALPEGFPGRDLIVLCAFCVVLGTLVIQGFTVAPLMRLMNFPADRSGVADIAHGRSAIMRVALDVLQNETGEEAGVTRAYYSAALVIASDVAAPRRASGIDELRLKIIAAQRAKLAQMRRSGEITDDTFATLQEEIDWTEMDATPAGTYQALAVGGD